MTTAEKGIDYLSKLHEIDYSKKHGMVYVCDKNANKYGITEIRTVDDIIYFTDGKVGENGLSALSDGGISEHLIPNTGVSNTVRYLEISDGNGEEILDENGNRLTIHYNKKYELECQENCYSLEEIEDFYNHPSDFDYDEYNENMSYLLD